VSHDRTVAVRIAAERGLNAAGKTAEAVAILADALSDESDSSCMLPPTSILKMGAMSEWHPKKRCLR